MRRIAHRGCPDHGPENTVAAVRTAAPYVDMVEIDVQRCKSGEIVVFHDERLGRLTDASGPVSEYTYDDLSSLTVGTSAEPIPRLTDVLDALPPGTGVNVELKHAGMAPDLIPQLSDYDEPVIVSSFDAGALSAFRNEPIQTAYLFTYPFRSALDRAVELGCEYLHPHHRFVDEAAITRAHDHGFAVNAWTVPSEPKVRDLRAAGVDGVIVDSWEIVSPLEQHAQVD
ncbi:glycerophosphodiester phosphodiesterase [Halovenus halobia]|uniref:glycerophosphodiester phosphodiesterase n=1 Tax=Halovenus halobia TaxID=3396622 RepID=UPI003F57F4C7